MFSLRKPSGALIRRFLSDQEQYDFTYAAVGATLSKPPAEFVVDHTRVLLGEGQPAFDAARIAIKRWEHFQLGWVETDSRHIPIERGQIVGVMARALGVWVLNACRIVSVIDEVGDVCRYGFVYGTLPGHVESGEERFQIEWKRSDATVRYDILAFSRPNHVLSRLGYPLVRRLQKKFAHDSAEAMVRFVSKTTSITEPNDERR